MNQVGRKFTLPGQLPETAVNGMNSRDTPKLVPENVAVLLKNALPGLIANPRHGMTDAFMSTTALGYGTIHTTFRPAGTCFLAGGKTFFLAWSRGKTTGTDEYNLEVWNLTDSTRTALAKLQMPSAAIECGFEKIYNALYAVIEYEATTNRTYPYTKGNFIVEWDSATATLITRSMMIDVAPAVTIEAIGNLNLPFGTDRTVVCTHSGYVYAITGKNVYRSTDGEDWLLHKASAAFTAVAQQLTSVLLSSNGLMFLISEIAGSIVKCWTSADGLTWTLRNADVMSGGTFVGSPNGFSAVATPAGVAVYVEVDTFESLDGIAWTHQAHANFTSRYGQSMWYHDGKLWVAGGWHTAATHNDVYYSSNGGVSWTQATAAASWTARMLAGAIANTGKMWILGGSNGTTQMRDVWSSADGITWTQATATPAWSVRADAQPVVLNAELFVFAGSNTIVSAGNLVTGSPYFSEGYKTTDGVTWVSALGGRATGLYVSFALTYVRRKDTDAIMPAVASYTFPPWRTVDGTTYTGDERLLNGTVSLDAAGTLTGVGTAFNTELVPGDYVRIAGSNAAYLCLTRTNDTTATLQITTVVWTTQLATILPDVGDPITTNVFAAGAGEGIEDSDLRQVFSTTTVDGGTCFKFSIPTTAVTEAVAQGATHVRVWSTLGALTAAIAETLSHRYIMDIPITGDSFWTIPIRPQKVAFDNTTDATLEGELHFLEVTGYSPAPPCRYVYFDTSTGHLWVFGDPAKEGYAYHSATPGVLTEPQKYYSWFNQSSNFVSCNPSDGSKGTGLSSLSGDLYFFKERSIFVLDNGDINKAPRQVSDGLGCAFPHTLVRAYIPKLKSYALLFLSEIGPMALLPGGRIEPLYDFAIAHLWRQTAGEVIVRSTGAATTWYTRNKVWGVWWANTYYLMWGDPHDATGELTTHRCFGMHFGDTKEAHGPFEVECAKYQADHSSNVQINEPQMLLPVNDVAAYSLSHATDDAFQVCYRLVRWMDPATYVDSHEVT